MNSRKGWTLAHYNEQYPHHVLMRVPGDGFGVRGRQSMEDWCAERGVKLTAGDAMRKNTEPHAVRWVFADAAVADAFQREFGGERQQHASNAGRLLFLVHR